MTNSLLTPERPVNCSQCDSAGPLGLHRATSWMLVVALLASDVLWADLTGATIVVDGGYRRAQSVATAARIVAPAAPP